MKNRAEKTYTKEQIMSILEHELIDISANKNRYIELNGYSHKETLNYFSSQIAEVLHVMSLFK